MNGRAGTTRILRTAFSAVSVGVCLIAGLTAGLTVLWSMERSGMLSLIAVDPRVDTKWPPAKPEVLRPSLYYSLPSVASGTYFKRRPRDVTVSEKVLAREAERNGYLDHPYRSLPEVKVRYGRYGFRDDIPPVRQGVAIVGSSFAEAGYLSASDSWEGQLLNRFGIRAANFGVARAGGYSIRHFLEAYVLPSSPSQVVWVFSERSDFSTLAQEAQNLKRSEAKVSLPGLKQFISESWDAYYLNALASGWAKLRDNAIRLGIYDSKSELPEQRRYELQRVTAGGREIVFQAESIPETEMLDKGKELIEPLIGELAGLCRKSNAKFSILFIPSRKSMFAPYLPSGTPMPPIYREALWQAAKLHDVPISDVTSALREAIERGVQVVNPVYDQHLSAAGVAIASEVLADQLSGSKK